MYKFIWIENRLTNSGKHIKIHPFIIKSCYLLINLLLINALAFSESQTNYSHLNNRFFKKIINYSATNINQLWSNDIILQDKKGMIYVGNLNYMPLKGNLHQYDGVSWRTINSPDSGVLSMAMDDKGTIYTGGHNDIGFIFSDSNGIQKYQSLMDQLDEDKKDFGFVFYTHSIKEGIYFNCKNFLFRWNTNSHKIKVWQSKQNERFLSSFKCHKVLFDYQENKGLMRMEDDKLKPIRGSNFFKKFLSSFKFKYQEVLFIHQENKGLMRMEDDELKPIPGGKIFKDKQICMMVGYKTKKILIGTKRSSLYIFDGTQSRPFPTEADEFLKKNQINHGIQLSSGDFALGTKYGGLIIMDSNGRFKQVFNKSYGLQDNEVYYVYEDIQGNLWLAMETGISRIEYFSPISINNGISPYIYSIIKHQGSLYTGTENGLFSLSTNGKFNHIPGTSSRYYDLISIDESLFSATSKGVFQLVNNKNHIIIEGDHFYCLLQSQLDTNRIWATGQNGLYSIYKQNNIWKKECHFENITQCIQSIVEDKNGNLWLGFIYFRNPAKEIALKVDFPGNGSISSPTITPYQVTTQALPHYASYIYKVAGHLMFSTRKGLYRFDEKNKTFIPDLTFGLEFAGSSKTKDYFKLVEDKNKNIWLYTNYKIYLAKLQPDDSYTIHSKPFKRIQSFYWFPIYPDPQEDITWIGGKGELIRYDMTIENNYEINFPTLIRRVLANGKLVFNGNNINRRTSPQYRDFIPNINYNDQSLRFEFAAPFFQDESNTQYRYILEGYSENWSQWGWETQKEYNSLPPGLYKFRAQSKNVYQHPGKEAVFQFRILLPWYRTWWAFLSYAFMLFIITYLFIKWRRSVQLENEKLKLEQTVIERTKEIEEQSEKLKEMDKVKSRFFANISHEFRTPLTLIMGPLEQIYSNLQDRILKKKAHMAHKNSQRLLGLINQLLDLSKLDSGKMKLDASCQNIITFLKGIISTFEPVLEKKMLDLAMNFQKENINLYFDTEKLEHVILNLLGNAVKFTPAGGKIMISVAEKKATGATFPLGSVDITVRDTGPGIPRDELTHIFDHFYQANSTYEKHPIGTGIGLALAKELVELHHGEILTQSRQGEGTEFIIRLPLGDSHLTPKEIVQNSEKQYQFKKFNDYPTPINHEKKQHLQLSMKDDLTTEDLNPKSTSEDESIEYEENTSLETNKNIILVVEDNKDLRDYIKESLEPLYKVQEAKNGHEGIQKAQEVIPDLIISDVMMPGVDGYQLCRQLKNHIKTSHIPIILLTAKASEENIIVGLETGADDYITKPFNTKILCARIKNLIDLRYQLQLKRKRQITMQPEELLLSSMDEEFYQELQEVIEKNLSDFEFNVDQLAKKLYMSRTSLYRKILALTGSPPHQFIRTYRLKRAAQLLKANFGNVTEVAIKVGFNNMAYFSKCFKDEFHQLPSSYQSSEAQS